MKKWFVWQLVLCGFVLIAQSAHAADVSLADWCFNINGSVDPGSITDNPSNGCNGGTNSPLASLSLSNFDTTLEPAFNNLGSAVVTLSVGNNNVAIYDDYDVSFSTFGSFDDSAAAVGTPSANTTFEIGDPGSSNIFCDFAGNGDCSTAGLPSSLQNTNSLGTPSAGVPSCCDASWALALSNIIVPVGGSGTVTFTVSTSAPGSGFYLQQTNNNTLESIYLSAVTNVSGPVGGATPEPSTFLLGLGVIGVGLFIKRRNCI